ncbi:MAG: glycerophosphodiester phosphodiesterase [Burkholderiales bacterium]|nr:glycerophosphodiester phosphodiesterase [Burkholderiales bacterium]
MTFKGVFGVICLAAAFIMTTPAYSLDLQGHRGARGLLPENTLPAFAKALAIGVTTLELDCAITKDSVVVVSHDAALNPDITRGPEGRWLARPGPAIFSLTYRALQRYDVGRIRPDSDYAARFSAQQAVDGTRIPRLADVFALVRESGNGEVRFNIETKIAPTHSRRTASPEVFAKKLISLIIKEKMDSRVTIQSFDWRTLQVVQREVPQIPTVYLTAQQPWLDNIRAHAKSSPWTAGLHVSRFGGSIPRMVQAAGGAVWSPYYVETTRENVREAQSLGLKVVVWTVNDETGMRRMMDLGVDGIISDYPDVLRRVAAERGIALPAAVEGIEKRYGAGNP